jgi:hypothetical protein
MGKLACRYVREKMKQIASVGGLAGADAVGLCRLNQVDP